MDTNSLAGQLARRRPGRGPLRRAARAVSAIFSAGAVVARLWPRLQP